MCEYRLSTDSRGCSLKSVPKLPVARQKALVALPASLPAAAARPGPHLQHLGGAGLLSAKADAAPPRLYQ